MYTWRRRERKGNAVDRQPIGRRARVGRRTRLSGAIHWVSSVDGLVTRDGETVRKEMKLEKKSDSHRTPGENKINRTSEAISTKKGIPKK